MPDNKPQKPNLDLINMVQQARMQHDRAAKPSEVAAVYWIEAKDMTGTAPPPTVRAAQWTLKTTVNQVDELWEAIKVATETGELGYKSKVSTTSREDDIHTRTVCVLAHDRDDTAEIERLKARLIELGIDASALKLDSVRE